MSGRPCTVCTNPNRSQVEDSIASGTAISSITDTFLVSRQALQRHRDHHMTVATFHPDGLGPWQTLLRLTATADRLHDLADAAEQRGRIADAARAVQAEGKVLGQLLSLGVEGQQQVDIAEDYAALESAVATLIRRAPAAGDVIAEALEHRGRTALAATVRTYAQRCRDLPQHQGREISGADH